MNTTETHQSQSASALRWGGASGMLGSLSLLFVFGMLAALVGLETLAIEGEIQRYPEIRSIRALENTMYLLATALWTVHTAALLVALRETAFGPALVGGVTLALGTTILATGAVPHTATDPLSGLYHAAGATPESKAVAVAVWQGVQGIVDALVVTGLVLTPIGMAFLGLAMMRDPRFGGTFGAIALLLGLAGAGAALLILAEPSDIAAIGIFAVVFFHLIIGWRTFRAASLAA